MNISTKWNHSKKAPFSYVHVHAGSDSPRIRAQYLKYSEGNSVGGKPGFYSIDISTRGGVITLYLDHEHVEGLVEKLQQGMADYTSVDTPVAVCQAG
tara:strand:- start:477 stop:767 length:291 start_codon:yes stop_codon:yes gene_type:complete